jgi:hypothetical protein
MKALLGLVLLGVVVGIGAFFAGRYMAIDACTELDRRVEEAGRPPAPGVPVSEESAQEAVKRAASQIPVELEEVSATLEPLTQENAGTISDQAQKAVAMASKLANHKVQGKILAVRASGRAKRILSTQACEIDRRLLLAGQ